MGEALIRGWILSLRYLAAFSYFVFLRCIIPRCIMFIDPTREIVIFARLAQAFKGRLMLQDRDRALVMTGVCASMLQMEAIANFCHQLILKNNRGHLLKRYDSFEEALKTEDFVTFLKQVRRKLPTEKAETQLEELGYHCPVKRKDYDDPDVYIAAILGVDFDWVKENFS